MGHHIFLLRSLGVLLLIFTGFSGLYLIPGTNNCGNEAARVSSSDWPVLPTVRYSLERCCNHETQMDLSEGAILILHNGASFSVLASFAIAPDFLSA